MTHAPSLEISAIGILETLAKFEHIRALGNTAAQLEVQLKILRRQVAESSPSEFDAPLGHKISLTAQSKDQKSFDLQQYWPGDYMDGSGAGWLPMKEKDTYVIFSRTTEGHHPLLTFIGDKIRSEGDDSVWIYSGQGLRARYPEHCTIEIVPETDIAIKFIPNNPIG